MAHLQTSLNFAYFWGEQLCSRLPFWVRRRQERESKPSRAFSAQNNSVIIKQNKTALKLHSWWTLWLSSPLKINRPSSLTELRPKIFTPCVGGGKKPGVPTPSQNPKDIFFFQKQICSRKSMTFEILLLETDMGLSSTYSPVKNYQ